MKSRIIIFLCALMMCLTTNTLVANPTPQPVVGQPTMLFIAKDGQVSKKEARKQAEKERIKGYRVTKSMRWHSVIGIAVCAISILLLYKQAKKRKLLTKVITKHIAERHDYVKYNYKYYIDTYQCLHCNETFTKHRSDKTKIGTV